MYIKLLFKPGNGRILGAQIVGIDGVDKRIDVIATALRCQLCCWATSATADARSCLPRPAGRSGCVTTSLMP